MTSTHHFQTMKNALITAVAALAITAPSAQAIPLGGLFRQILSGNPEGAAASLLGATLNDATGNPYEQVEPQQNAPQQVIAQQPRPMSPEEQQMLRNMNQHLCSNMTFDRRETAL